MKVLVIGGTGMLGHKLVQRLGSQFDVWTTIRSKYADVKKYGIFLENRTFDTIDVTDEEKVFTEIRALKPDVVINAAGIVKRLATKDNIIETLTVNAIFPQKLATLSAECDFRLVTISTDCVFSGTGGGYTEESLADACDLYGQSKHFGEVYGPRCLSIRTSIVGRELSSNESLVEWFLKNRGQTVKGFTKAIFSGFPTIVFADIIAHLIADHPSLAGLYHLSADPITKFDLLNLLNQYLQAGVNVVGDSDFEIDRSLDSTKFRKETGFIPQNWGEMIETMAADPTPYDQWHK